jgi:NADH-quinone oxidoreductase subunit L
MNALLISIWLLPLVGAILLWAFGPQLNRAAGVVGTFVVFFSFGLTVVLFDVARAPGGLHVALGSWVPGFDFGLLLDPLALLWALVITGIGGLIHAYAIGYMWSDKAIARFFAYMNFFVFAMLTLVLSDNFVGLLVGWGLVGLASYFLISFWFYKPSAVAAGRKAFVINVFGDIGLMLAIFVIFAQLGSLGYASVFSKVGHLSTPTLLLVCVALFVACAAKSAQVPLHTWLPDAMEGPTPVSALIHAATMVTAGVYLIARCAPIFNASPQSQELVGIIGALTALTGAILGMAQWDIKRVLAYSTMSQIGYMIMGVGVGAYEAGVLHFWTHAFFKAQLFLGAGLVIHALHDEQDLRKMGGLRRRMPFAFLAMLLGTLAIIGFPGLSGFFSKDAVIYGVLERGHPMLFGVGVLVAGLTAYYMFRMIFIAFFGTYRGELDDAAVGVTERAGSPEPEDHAVHLPDWVMQGPVAILMIGTVGAGWFAIGGTASPWYRFFGDTFGTSAASAGVSGFPELASTILVLVIVAVGFAVAYARYGSPNAMAHAVDQLRNESRTMPPILVHAFYVDDALDALFVRPARALGTFFARFVDPHVIDGGVKDLVWLASALGLVFRVLQNGLVRTYAFTLVAGAAAILVYAAWLGSR